MHVRVKQKRLSGSDNKGKDKGRVVGGGEYCKMKRTQKDENGGLARGSQNEKDRGGNNTGKWQCRESERVR